ncbi:MAG: SpoIIE family protein phosphatase, partial [Bacteroidales bacterium]|nr:SpoIIE family protein phosphatase [Bacteroidales bacterium]
VEKEGAEVQYRSLATEEYNYPEQEWFVKPLKSNKGYWSEPYIDEGGGDILMTTFSMPVHDKEGNIAAILTADISLDWLTGLIGDIEIYPHAFSMMISRTGKVMVCPVKDFEMNRQVWEITPELNDPVGAESVVEAMLNGEKGNRVLGYRKGKFHVYYEPVERTGWSMCIVIPQAEIFGKLRRIFWLVTLMQLVGLLMLGLIMRAAARSQKKYFALSENKEKMENELRIASEIQKSMIPKTFPPFPERKDIDMAAAIIPAKEVGGDLYDFYIRDEKLFFCIGDVSGKGVPASLVMAVTRSLFRAVSAHETRPGAIVTKMNDSMTDINENDMFVTFFCGILDLANGHLRYCNAGHNAPVALTDAKAFLPVEANLPLGIMKGMEFREQEMTLKYDDALFLYTDGITEAENSEHEQFGEKRMLDCLSQRKSSQNHLDNVSNAVRSFVGDTEQSDDITMLFIHYLNQ